MNTRLKVLNINNCRISNILLVYNENLEWFDCNHNDLKYLDLRETKKLSYLNCIGNKSLRYVYYSLSIEKVISDIVLTQKEVEKNIASRTFRRLQQASVGPHSNAVPGYRIDETGNLINNNYHYDITIKVIDLDDDEVYKELIYGNYSGSYAQDYENWSDKDIDDALEGDPENYWNID
jgi:hypothetical protein